MGDQDSVGLCFPELLNSSCRKPTLPWSELVLLNLLWSFISLITAVLNLLVIISVCHFRQLHTPTNILLLSLAFSDFLVGVLVLPAEITRQSSCWFFGDHLCSLYMYLSFVITSSSIGIMVLISVDRYVAICDPLHYPVRVTENRVKVCVCLCWFSSFFYNSLFVKEELIQPGRSNTCYGECMLDVDYNSQVIDLTVTFVVPVSVIIILYSCVFVVAVSQARAMRSHVTAVNLQLSVSLTTRKSELKAARTLGVLVLVFLICFCPYYFILLIGNSMLTAASVLYVSYMFLFNSCVNPLIYAFFYTWFRKAMKLILSLRILQPGSCKTNIL